MKLLRTIVALFVITQSIHANTPFVLTGVKSYYPVVEINSDRIEIKYKKLLTDMIVKRSQELGIDTQNFSSRSLAFLVRFVSVGETIALKLELMLGENAIRLDTKEEIFVISYMNARTFIVEDFEEDLIDNAENMLDAFAAQYKEDNL